MKSISCPLCCNSTFASQQDLRSHLLKVTENLRCPACSVFCSNITTLIEHLDSCFNQTKKSISNQKTSIPSRLSRNSKSKFDLNDNSANDSSTFTKNTEKDAEVKSSKGINGKTQNNGNKRSLEKQNTHFNGKVATKEAQDEDQDDSEDDDDDDLSEVEGFYCTVCDVKIPSIVEHIRDFHTGQEVILQDGDEEEDEDEVGADEINGDVSDSSHLSSPDSDDEFLPNGAENRGKNKITDKSSDLSARSSPAKKKSTFRHNSGKKAPRRESAVKSKSVINPDDSVDIKQEIESDDGENSEKFYCTHCDISFVSIDEHMTSFHQTQDFVLQNIEEALLMPKTVNGKLPLDKFPYKCPHCKSCFGTKSYLIDHLHSHIEDTPSPVSSRKDKVNTVVRKSLKRSRTSEVLDDPVKIKKPYSFEISEEAKSFEEPKEQRTLNKFFDRSGPFDRYLCDICDKYFSRNGFEAHMKKHNDFECKICDEPITTFIDFLKHRKTHDDDVPYSCRYCPKLFNYKSTLKIHLTSHKHLIG